MLAHDPTLGQPTARSPLPAELRPARALLGRDAELERLRQAWQRAVRGRPTTLVVRGPAGGGGSALAAAFAAEVAREGAEVRYAGPGRAATASDVQDAGPSLLVADHVPPTTEATLVLQLSGHLAAVTEGAEVLDLTPLDARHVRELVADYVPPDVVDVVTDEVLRRSGGWPGAVHEAVVDAARARAMRRVELAAVATGASTVELASARAELADNVALLQDTNTALETADPTTCPWRGLAAYDVDDARWYAGRERLVAELVARLAGTRLLALVGASGSGKSSALRAGLVAALSHDVLPGSAAWPVVTMRPGPHPMKELARGALGRAAKDDVAELLAGLVSRTEDDTTRVLVVVDQFEEVWTVCDDDSERRQFLDTLTELATDPRSPVTVVLAVRADFMGELADHEALRGLITDGTVLVGPMTPAEIRRAVERPAAAGCLALDDGLADTVVSDAGQEPGLLPLLSTAMSQVWEQRDGRSLTYAAYVGLGGLSGAIATLAEEAYAGLPRDQGPTARALLLRLTGPGDGAGVTRRRVPLTELDALPHPSIRAVVEELARARLLTVSEGSVEVAHEALFREWPRLRTWLVEDAAGRAVQRRLAVAAADWDAEGRETSALWTGTRLASGLEVADARPEEITSTEREFLDASRDAVDAEQRATEQRAVATARQNRRLRWLVAGIGVVLVAALVAGLLAWRSQQEAQAASVSAEAKGLAATALNIKYPDTALLAAVESTKLEQSPETYGALLTLLARQPQVVHRVRTPNRFLRIAVSPDGRTVYVTENAPVIHAIDADTGETLWSVDMPAKGQGYQPSVTADGRGVILPEGGDKPGVVRLDADSGKVVWATRELDRVVPGASPWVAHGGLRADGRFVVTTDSHVFTLDADTGDVLGSAAWPEPVSFADLFRVWPDGRVSQDAPDKPGSGMVFDPARPERGTTELDGIPLSFSPDGSRVVLAGDADGESELRVATTADPNKASPWVRVPAFVRSATWSPDGSRVIVTTDDGIQPFDPDTLRLGPEAAGHSGAVMDARFTGPDGDMVWTAGRDGTAIGFDLSGRRTPIASRPADPTPHTGKSSTDGERGIYQIVPPDEPNRAYVTDLSTGRDIGELLPDVQTGTTAWEPEVVFQTTGVAITPDGATSLVGVEGFLPGTGPVPDRGVVAIFDTDSRQQRALVELPWPTLSIAVTPDGRRAVVNGLEGYAVIDLRAARIVGQPVPLEKAENIEWTQGAEVSPDGRLTALARNDEVVLIDVASGAVARRGQVVKEEDHVVQGLAWSADSSTIAAGSDAGWLHVVSAQTLDAVAPPRLITGGWVIDLETSPDGRLMASTGSDGDVTLWDTSTWRPYGQPITSTGTLAWLTFSRDGSTLRVFFERDGLTEISTEPSDWVDAACKAAGRNLTPEEAAVLLPNQPARPTCPDAA